MKKLLLQFLLVSTVLLAQATQQTITLPVNGYILAGCQVDGTGGNNINNTSFLQVPASFPSTQVEMLVWNCGDYSQYYYFNCADSPDSQAGWYDAKDNYVDVGWNPGEGMVIKNLSAASSSFTLNGTTPTPVLPPNYFCGCGQWSLLSSQTNSATSTYQQILGFAPVSGSEVSFTYSNGGPVDPDTYSNGNWSPAAPILTNGQAAFFFVPCASNGCITILSTNLTISAPCGSNCLTIPLAASAIDTCCTNVSFQYYLGETIISSTNTCFSVGTTNTVTVVATDACGNSAENTFNVTVLVGTNCGCCGPGLGPQTIQWLDGSLAGGSANPVVLSPTTCGSWLVTNLPCYGRVLITETAPADITDYNNSDFQNVPNGGGTFVNMQTGYGPYDWGFCPGLNFVNTTGQNPVAWTLNFYFLDGPPSPCTLYLDAAGLAQYTTATVSQPVVFRGEYHLGPNVSGSAYTCISNALYNPFTGAAGITNAGAVGTIIGSYYNSNNLGDDFNTGWALFQPAAALQTTTLPQGSYASCPGYPAPATVSYLSLNVSQESGDGINFLIGYVCCTNPAINCINLECPSNIVLTTCSNCVAANFSASATDLCCSNLQITYGLNGALIETNYCFPVNSTNTVDVVAADSCGNAATNTFNVTVLAGTNCGCCGPGLGQQTIQWLEGSLSTSSFNNVVLSATTCGSWLVTNLPCYGRVLITETFPGNVNDFNNAVFENVPNGSGDFVNIESGYGPYNWGYCPSFCFINTFSSGQTFADNLDWTLNFYFMDGPPSPCNLYLDASALAQYTTATVSQPVVFRGEYDLPGSAHTCITNNYYDPYIFLTGVTNAGKVGTVIGSYYNGDHVGDDLNTGWALFQPVATLQTTSLPQGAYASCPGYPAPATVSCLSLNISQQDSDEIGFMIGYVCCTNSTTTNCITLQCPSNIVLTTCSNCAAADFSASATDLCCSNLQITYGLNGALIDTNYCFPVNSTNTVDVVAADGCDNVSGCSFTVTVLPGASCATNGCITILSTNLVTYAPCNTNCVTVPLTASAIDTCCSNVGVQYYLGSTFISATGTCFSVDTTNAITVVAVDGCGNAATNTFNVTVLAGTNCGCCGPGLGPQTIQWLEGSLSTSSFNNVVLSATTCGSWLVTNLPCYGRVLITETFPGNVNDFNNAVFENVPNGSGDFVNIEPGYGPYNWGYCPSFCFINTFSSGQTFADNLDWTLNFYFLDGPPSPCNLYLDASALAQYTTATVSQPVVFRGEYDLPGSAHTCITNNYYDPYIFLTGVTNAGKVGTVIGSYYNGDHVGDDLNTGWALFQPVATLQTTSLPQGAYASCPGYPAPATVSCLSLNISQQDSDEIGFMIGYVCCTNSTTNCISLQCPSNIVLTTCSNCAAANFSASATDLCCSNVQITYGLNGTIIDTNYCFPVNTTNTVDVVAADSCGNTASSSFTVAVIQETNPPVILSCPTNVIICTNGGAGGVGGPIIVDSDELALSNVGFSNEGDGQLYATNCAAYLTRGFGKNILIYSSNSGLNNTSLYYSLVYGGYNVTMVTPPPTPDLTESYLSAYNAVFVGGDPLKTTELQALAAYVCDGGGVYVAAGTGDIPVSNGNTPAEAEAAQWNYFLNPFGLNLADTYNSIQSVLTVSGGTLTATASPVMAGVGVLDYANGNDITVIAGDPLAQVIAYDGSEGLIAVSGCVNTAGSGCGVMPDETGLVITSGGGTVTQSIPPGTTICSNTFVTFTVSNLCGEVTQTNIPCVLINCASNGCITIVSTNLVAYAPCNSNCVIVPLTASAIDACCSNNVSVRYYLGGTSISSIDTCFSVNTTNTVEVVATDGCGNSNSTSFTVTVLPTTNCPPCFQFNCPTNMTVQCGTLWTSTPPTIIHSCCPSNSIFRLSSVTNGTCPKYITNFWQVSDSCGDTDICTQEITVVDTTAPVITGGTNPVTGIITTNCELVIPPISVTATDSCTPECLLGQWQSPTNGTIVPGPDAYVTVTVTDLCGNAAQSKVLVQGVYKRGLQVSWPTQLISSNCLVPCVSPTFVDCSCPTDEIRVTQSPGCDVPIGPGQYRIHVMVKDCHNLIVETNIPLSVVSVDSSFLSILFDTGIAANGGLLHECAVDPHYTLGPVTATSPGGCTLTGYTPPDALAVNNLWPWMEFPHVSEWISPNCEPSDMRHSPYGFYTYTNRFVLPQGVIASSASISGRWAADNGGVITFNGTTTGNKITSSLNPDYWTPFTINANFLAYPQVNTVLFIVTNDWRAGCSPTGLRVEYLAANACSPCSPPAIASMTTPPNPLHYGSSYTFNVQADGTPPLTYQWLLNNRTIAGANGSSLRLNHITWSSAGIYTVIVSDPCGSVTNSRRISMVVPLPWTNGWWTFDEPTNPLTATFGPDLVMNDLDSGTNFSLSIGNTEDLGLPNQGGQIVNVLGLNPLWPDTLTLPSILPAGSTSNTDYTVIMDIYQPDTSEGTPSVLFESAGDGSGVALTLDVSNYLDITGMAADAPFDVTSAMPMSPDSWHRLALVVSGPVAGIGGSVIGYLDGGPFTTEPVYPFNCPCCNLTMNSAIYYLTNPPTILSGTNGNLGNGELYVSSVQFHTVALAPQIIAALSAPDSGPLPNISNVTPPAGAASLSASTSSGTVNFTWQGGGYVLQETTDLTSGEWADSDLAFTETETPGGGVSTTAVVNPSPGAPAKFYRLVFRP